MYEVEIKMLCKDKANILKEKEIKDRKERILQILEDSKKLVDETNTLAQLNSLEIRCKKISTPRKTAPYDKDYRRKVYEKNKDLISAEASEKRRKIRETPISDISDFVIKK